MLSALRERWNRRYSNWVPEVALRYLPVVDALRQSPPRGLLLEVGGHNAGLTCFYPSPVVGVDVRVDRGRSTWIRPVCARGQRLPFRARAVDTTVCLDTLEHVPPADRGDFVRELLRVTGRRLILGCPMGSAAEDEDREVDAYYRKIRGTGFEFLDEHLQHGLPDLDTVRRELTRGATQIGCAARIQVQPNQNLWIHRRLMKLWIRTGPLSYLLHRLAVLLVHVRRGLNLGRCYRFILIVDLHPVAVPQGDTMRAKARDAT
ncbi:MAG: class I SAM-dependent methyltransferase [Nitrospirales bacterium]